MAIYITESVWSLNFQRILWHVNPLLGNAHNTHTANHTGALFSLCPCSLRMHSDVNTEVLSNHVHVLSVGSASAPVDWLGSSHVTCVFCDACPCCIYRNGQNSKAEAVSWRSTEDYKKSVCVDLCVIWRLCVHCSTVILGVCDLVRLL
jgi:hypothetical protein